MSAPPSPPKVALVTSSSSGLGAAIARTLALDLRMSVTINYHSPNGADRANALVSELTTSYAERYPPAPSGSSSTPGTTPIFRAIKADVTNKADIQRLVADVAAAFPGNRLDVVVSNVGWTRARNFMDLDDNVEEEDWDTCFNGNVKSHLWLFHAARPYLEASNAADPGGACFVSTASVAGVKPSGSSLAYAVTKAALLHLVKGLAVIAAPGVRVNAVSPGLLRTDWTSSYPPERFEALEQACKLKRIPTVEDVAEQVKAYVVSKSITGQNIVMDGGFSL